MAQEINQVVQVAGNLVLNVRKLLEHREDYARVQASEFPAQRRRYYEETGRELAAEGVTVLGDVEDVAHTRSFPQSRAFSRFGRGAGGAVTAQWFAVPVPAPDGEGYQDHRCLVLRTWLEDGRLVLTARGGKDNGCPNGPWRLIHMMADTDSTRDVARRHQRNVAAAGGTVRRLGGIDDILKAIAADDEAERDFRRGLGVGIFEPILRKLTGEAFETQGRVILETIEEHPEWLEGDDGGPGELDDEDGEPGGGTDIAVFLCSEESADRRHLTTVGLSLIGCPELQMRGLAANHLRAARFLMNTVARKLSALGPADLEAGVELSVSLEDVSPGDPYVIPGWFPEVPTGQSPARVWAVLEPFEAPKPDQNGDSDGRDGGGHTVMLLTLRPPPDHRAGPDVWLREACRCLGQDAPAALPAAAMPAEMRAASERARARLGDLARRFRGRSGEGDLYLIKTVLTADSGGQEYVWMKLLEWQPDGVLVGELMSEPVDCARYKAGTELRLNEADVFDHAIHNDAGQGSEPSRTNLLALEFGLDL